MAESLEHTEPRNDTEQARVDGSGTLSVPRLLETSDTTSRLRIALLEHERNRLAAQVDELAARIEELEAALVAQKETQQVIDQYERILAEKDRIAESP